VDLNPGRADDQRMSGDVIVRAGDEVYVVDVRNRSAIAGGRSRQVRTQIAPPVARPVHLTR
jgi:hypothetical protein